MRINSKEEAFQAIEDRKNRWYGLKQFEKYMKDKGNPQLTIPCIHVAGTNGKGSTSNFIANILISAGYKVGVFTSPYLENILDSISVNLEYMETDIFMKYVNEYFGEWEEAGLSTYEINMFMAVNYFVEKKVDIVIYEVGLGGEFDATNIISPMLTVITNIGKDHIHILGDSYEEIAGAKAGIIKKDVPVITYEDKEVCLNVFKKKCEEVHTKLYQSKHAHNINVSNHVSFTLNDKKYDLKTVAYYQAHNAALALSAVDLLPFEISEEAKITGLKNAEWKGRFEQIYDYPRVFIDGAHNEEGMRALKSSAGILRNPKIIFSALKDKPYDEMIKLLMSISNDICISEFEHERAQSADELASNFSLKVERNWKKAVDEALNQSNDVLITGSLYFISKVRKYIIDKKKV